MSTITALARVLAASALAACQESGTSAPTDSPLGDACTTATMCDIESGHECRDGICVAAPDTMIVVEPGTFGMGTSPDDPVDGTDEAFHEVTITRRLLVDRFELTEGAWSEVTGAAPAAGHGCTGGERCPLTDASFFTAVAYANARSTRAGLTGCYVLEDCHGDPTVLFAKADGSDATSDDHFYCARVRFAGTRCPGYRLPTEAEWEFLARAGAEGQTYAEPLDAIAWTDANAGGVPHAVGDKIANAWDLHDMIGNVREWVWDPYQADYASLPPANPVPREPSANCPLGGYPSDVWGASRVVRGGSWASGAYEGSVARRRTLCPDTAGPDLGFRLVRTIGSDTSLGPR